MFDRTVTIFESIVTKISKHKYFIDNDTKVMSIFTYPKSELDSCYGLRKHLMPYPAYYLLYPPLR